ncbi:MAG: transcriptional repressor [Bryobacterales bacterium]|nr:transcriptional repressor [Bryobacterales bacterium]
MISSAELEHRMEHFRARCAALGLAYTHQRMVIYRALAGTDAHPTPEAVYEQVKREIPAISLGTVYKNIHTFTEAGLLREVNLLHESLRLDANLGNHHHFVCVRCKSVTDIPERDIGPLHLRQPLPEGYVLQRAVAELLGVCARCAGSEDVISTASSQ